MEFIGKLIEILKPKFPEIKENNFQFPSEFGDIACNICFEEAKKKNINPKKLAEEIVQKIKLPKEFEKVEAANGYLNFYLNYKEILDHIFKIKIKKFGKGKVMIEFSHPNPCKAMHLGNARTTLLGESLSRILDYVGYNVIKANYYNDLGKQVAKEIIAFKKYGLKKDKKIDHELAEIYAKLHEEERDLDDKAQDVLRGLEIEGRYKNIWKKIVNYAIEGFNETYKKLKIDFDVVFFESDFREEGKKFGELLLKKGLAYSEDKAIIVDLEKFNLPKAVIIKKDGTGLYITADLALTVYKFERFNLSKSIWIVSQEQSTYFKQLFKILELLGYKWYKNCIHVNYGIITYQGSKMSSRSGRYILLDNLIDELIRKAEQEIKKRKTENVKILDVAEKIALGALKYEILKVDRNKTIDFNPDKAISFEGNTGPYLQYMVVRCNSILRKIGELKIEKIKKVNEYEKNLLRKFLEFPIVMERCCTQLKPNLICNYAYELATTFSKFYENCKVIGSNKEFFRVNLVKKTKEILEICLNLLGIEAPERM